MTRVGLTRAGAARAGVVVVAAGLLSGGCTTPAGPPVDPFRDSTLPPSRVQVDSPELRALKRDTDIAPCPRSDSTAEAVEDGLADITLPCLGGGRDVHLAGLRGKPMVVNLWASWCGPCREELPALQEFHELAGDAVLMLGVDFEDTQPTAALTLLRNSGVTYPQVADFDKAIDATLGRHAVPLTLLVDAEGRVARVVPTPIESADQLAGLVAEALGVEV